MNAGTSVFDYVYPATLTVDSIRYLLLLYGAAVFCLAVVRLLQHACIWTCLLGLSLGLLTTVQELEAIGDPFYPWRLPLLIVANVTASVVLYRLPPRRTP